MKNFKIFNISGQEEKLEETEIKSNF